MRTLKSAWVLLVALFFVLVYLIPLNGRLLWQPDETRYAEISREMLQRGDWIVPQLLGLRYFEKPVAGYWFNNISQWLFGESNFAVRFASVFSTGLTAALIFILAWIFWRNRTTAYLATLIFLSMLLVLGVGTYSVLDPMISLWLTAAMLAFYLTLQAKSVAGKTGAYLLLGLACGMGFMTKGFLALAVPVIAVLPIVIQQRRVKELFLFGPIAIISALVLSLPWVLAINHYEPDYWRYFFWVEHIQRFAEDDAQHKAPFWYYLPVLCLAVMPWLALLPGALLKGWRERVARPELFFLLSWVVMPLLFFSIAKGKLVTYILPCMAPLAILMAAYAQDCLTQLRLRVLKINVLRINGLLNLLFGLLCLLAVIAMGTGIIPNVRQYSTDEWRGLMIAVLIFIGWMGFGLYAMGKGGERWTWSAACPVLLALLVVHAIPQRVIDSKQPQNFIHAHRDLLVGSRYVLSSSVGIAPGLAWELKRSDILLYDEKGEVKYGLSYPDAVGRYIDGNVFAEWLQQARQQGDVSLVLHLDKDGKIPDKLPPPDKIEQMQRLALLLYKAQPLPYKTQP